MNMATWLLIGMIILVLIVVITLHGSNNRPQSPAEPKIDPPAREPMRMIQMLSTGFLRIEGPNGVQEEQVPISPHAHGEYPQGIWGDGEGTIYLAAKQYTGRPGPDDGVLFRRKPDGTWDTFYREPSRFFCTIAGTPDGQLYVGSMKGVFHFDGTAWKFIPVDSKDRVEVHVRNGRVHATSNNRQSAWIFDGDVSTPSDVQPDESWDERIHTENGVTYSIFERSKMLGEVELDPTEEAEIRGEMAQIEKLAREGKLQVRKDLSRR